MNMLNIVLKFINGYKTYASAILAVVSGLGMILTQNYAGGLAQIFQTLLLLFGGASIVGMRHAIAKVEDKVHSNAAAAKVAR
jgi:hypothetical protein